MAASKTFRDVARQAKVAFGLPTLKHHTHMSISTAYQFSLCANATKEGVRDLLHQCRAKLAASDVPDDWLGMVELVLAEALNNINEHAYADRPAGRVSIMVTIDGDHITAHIRDKGSPLPDLAPPFGCLPDTSGPVETLPEGGFGRYLIQTLCEAVEYQRKDGENHLSLILNRTGKMVSSDLENTSNSAP